jgi:hypothetical protein
MSTKTINTLIHGLGSIVFLLLPVIFSPDITEPMRMVNNANFQRELLATVILLGVFYFNYYWLIPNTYFKQKYVLLASILLAGFALVLFLPELFIKDLPPELRRPFRELNHHPFPKPKHHIFFLKHVGNLFFQYCIVFVFALLIRIYNRWKASEQEKLNTELSYLKAQINPHFLFNTLNSIYAQTLEENAEKSAQSIITLSQMMRYVITESHNTTVALHKELEYINSYIQLQKNRLTNTVNISFQIKTDEQTANQEIAPMLLISFIENAFKYGVNPEKKSDIYIGITGTANTLLFSVKNNILNNHKHTESNGLGLRNAVKRLEMIYPAKHQLHINQTNTDFEVSLKIDLV